MITVRVISGTDWWLIVATIAGAVAVIGAAVAAALVSIKVSGIQDKAADRQNAAQYREGLNHARHQAYPELIQWAEHARKAYDARRGVPADSRLPNYAILWCCASPPLWRTLTQLTASWGGNLAQPPTGKKNEQVPELITNLTHQARWDLFGKEGFFKEERYQADYWQEALPPDPDDVTYF